MSTNFPLTFITPIPPIRGLYRASFAVTKDGNFEAPIHLMAEHPFNLEGFARGAGDSLCRRRATLVERNGARLVERTEAGHRVTCPSCKVRAHKLWLCGPERAAVGIFLKDKKILSVPRKYDHENLGLPGGKMEGSETYPDTLARECGEETGLIPIKSYALFEAPAEVEDWWGVEELYVARKSKLTCAFHVTEWKGTPKPMEGLPVKWVSADRMVDQRNSYSGFNKLAFKTAYISFSKAVKQ